METTPLFWQRLFPSENSSGAPVLTMKLLKKRGQPFLLLPSRSDLAASGLDLYPAQTSRSRLARSLARWALKAKLPMDSVRLSVSPEDPFVRWLGSLLKVSENQIPQFAVMAGNP